MPDENPVAPIANLGKRLRKEAEAIGLELKSFAIAPDLEGDTHKIQASFVLGDEPPSDDDKAFQEILRGQKEHEQQEKVEDERKQLEALRDDLRDKGKGIGLDD